MAISKQDLCGARTPADIERKYNFGKSFSEVMGFAEKAQRSAEEAQSAVSTLNENLSQEEIFNRLTNNGEAEGIFRDDDGQIYINAEYIVSLSKLFANEIIMSGKFVYETEAYIAPGAEEIATIQAHILGGVTIPADLIPLYDFAGVGGVPDGVITSMDSRQARKFQLGTASMADWPMAKKSTIRMEIDLTNPERAIRFTGTNMWGRQIDSYVGVNGTSITCPQTEARLDALEARIATLENA